MITHVGLRIIIAMLPYIQYTLNQAQVTYLFYLATSITTMLAVTKAMRHLMGKSKVKKATNKLLKRAQRITTRFSQEVETNLWKYLLATPFSARKRRQESSRRHGNQQENSAKRRKVHLPKLWLGSRKVLVHRYGSRSHFLHKLKRMKPPKTRKRKYYESLITMSSIKSPDDQDKMVTWDTDSFVIGIDQHTSAPISNDKRHFIQLEETTAKVVGVDGVPRGIAAGKGKLQWLVEDDNGVVHKWIIPNAYFIPNCPKCLLPPQYFAKYGNTNKEKTQCLQLWNRTVLRWGPNGEYVKTIWLGHDRSVPDMMSAASTNEYSAYTKVLDKHFDVESFEVSIPHIIEDDESVHEYNSDASGSHNMPQVIPFSSHRGETREKDENMVDIMQTAPVRHTLPNIIEPDDATLSDEKSIQSDSESSESPDQVNDNDNATDNANKNSRKVEAILQDEDYVATSDQAELLRWHYRLGHISFFKLRTMALLNIIPRRLAFVTFPKCQACCYGKQTKRPWRTKRQPRRIRPCTRPGECVSVDQLESSTIGFIAQLKGILTKRRYKCATVFVDHYSDLTYIHHHSRLTSEETVEAKLAFEAYARNFGVKIQNYHCDNGRFADNAFINECKRAGQSITYCSVNAHFQNGRAEKRIRDLREAARTMLLHAMARWPEATSIHLWPYAMRYATEIRNQMADKRDSSCPLSRFSNSEVASNLKDFHTFGCPVYTLKSGLASGKGIPHWQPRSRIGLYLGPSPRHARTVGLILNLQTGLASPQFHVSFDEFFETVRPTSGNPGTISTWQEKAGLKKVIAPKKSSKGDKPTQATTHKPTQATIQNLEDTPANNNVLNWAEMENSIENESQSGIPNELIVQDHSADDDGRSGTENNQAEYEKRSHIDEPRLTPIPTPPVTRSGRQTKWSRRYIEGVESNLVTTEDEEYYDALYREDYKIQDEMTNPISFSASSDPDTMYYHQAMKEPDRQEFIKAMAKEFNDHCDRGHWKIILKTEVPKGQRILDAVWSMKRKRDIKTRTILKYKARLNVHGGQQQYGVNYFETYSPVVNWFSVRLFLILSLLNNWHTKQVDFVLAYPQAPIECDLYMKMPKGIVVPGYDNEKHCLKLIKNIYGQKQAGRVWNQYLCEGLNRLGFVRSEVDECVWYKGSTIFMYFVDDGIICGPDLQEINQVIKDFRDPDKSGNQYDIEDCGDIKDYLGINFTNLDDGRLKLSQPHLVDQIIAEVGIEKSKSKLKKIPAPSSHILQRDLRGKDYDNDKFNYRSVIGKLNYLEKGTRPDIAYAVHQLARFSSQPKESHAEAVIWLVKYLKYTREEGLIFDPSKNKHGLEVYADADFVGNWNRATAEHDISTAKSRSGWIISMHGCPIVWHSKLQTQIALSTCEAEYYSLSQSLREAIPIMNLLKELKAKDFQGEYIPPIVKCKAFEDNSGALELALVPKMRPRTKHINITYHHFRKYVKDKEITVHPIDTSEQRADILTKPLNEKTFSYLRKLIMGW